MSEPRTIYEGATSSLTVTLSGEEPFEDSMTGEMSMDGGATWEEGEWLGDEDKVRKLRLIVTPQNAPAFPSECILLVRVDGDIQPAPNRRVLFREIPVP